MSCRSGAAWSRTLLFSALLYWLMSFYEDTREANKTPPLQFLADLLFVSVFAVDLYMRYHVRCKICLVLFAPAL